MCERAEVGVGVCLCLFTHKQIFTRTHAQIECFDWDRNSDPDVIGSFTTSLQELQSGACFDLMKSYPDKPKKKPKKKGVICFTKVVLTKVNSFLDYVKGGMEINLMVAVDFTGSNGHPDDASSLHYRGGRTMNQYQQVIQNIGSIVAAYDHDQMIPVWGFGGKVNNEVSHCFPLTFNNQNIEVHGVPGIMQVALACGVVGLRCFER